MKNKGIKKTFGILIAITLAAGMMTGCGEKKIEKMEQKTSVHEQKKTVTPWNNRRICIIRKDVFELEYETNN